MSDIDFHYADHDCYENEMAELYSYSEMEDWAIGLESFYKYTDNRNVSFYIIFQTHLLNSPLLASTKI